MSGYYTNQSDSNDEHELAEDNSGRGLRAQFEKLLKEHNELKASLHKASATDLLKDKGIDPALAELIPSDADPAQWVEKYGPLLGQKQSTPQMEHKQEQPEVIAPAQEDPAVVAEREALAQMNGAEATGSPAGPPQDALEQLEKVTSEEDLLKLIARAQGGAAG